ncbi:hypothetical protein OSTOST_15181 [Ostertagia ostertagi]
MFSATSWAIVIRDGSGSGLDIRPVDEWEDSSGSGWEDGSGDELYETCPPNMLSAKCVPICEADCNNPQGPTCDGIICGDEDTCFCKQGYVLVSADDQYLGCTTH